MKNDIFQSMVMESTYKSDPLHREIELKMRKRDVSGLALNLYFEFLKSRGVPTEQIETDLPYDAGSLHDKHKWIDYETFLVIEKRVKDIFPVEKDLFFKIGFESIVRTKGLGFIQVLTRVMISPYSIYLPAKRIVRRSLFSFINVSIERKSRSVIIVKYTSDPGYVLSEDFIFTVQGILSGFPLFVGASPATVELDGVSSNEAKYVVKLTNEWNGIFDFVRGVFNRVVFLFGTRRRYLGEAAIELEKTNLLLQDKVEALEEAQAELDRKLNDLSILNNFTQVTTRQLDLSELLEDAIDVFQSELKELPVAILVVDGDPPGLVIGAHEGFSEEGLSEVGQFANAEDPVTIETIQACKSPSFKIETEGKTWTIIPMRNSGRPIGALVYYGERSASKSDLILSMANQLAVAVDNCTSYKLVKELTDTLDLKVRERTTELELAKGQLEDTVIRLEIADRSKREFFTNVSHEFRTPLTLILGPLEELESSLRRTNMTADLDKLGAIKRNASHLLHNINEILDFTKLNEGRIKLNLTRIELNTIVVDLLSNLQPLAVKKSVDILFENPDRTIELTADVKLIRRVLINLIVNAIKYCSVGDKVSISLRASASLVTVSVSDTGPGIAIEQQQRIFERFERAVDRHGRVIEGSGIGLAMVKDIVELHNGSIELKSDEGKGASFSVNLPRKYSSAPPGDSEFDKSSLSSMEALDSLSIDDPNSIEEEPVVTSSHVSPSESGNSILVVEDNVEMRRFLVRLLKRDYVVHEASDGKSGCRIARQVLPDLILSDVMMPKMDGYELCRTLRSESSTQNTPIILLTARHSPEAAVEGFSAGADDYILKPFSPQELRARVGAQLRIRSLLSSLIRAEKQAAIGTMSAGIAHEVLNPINGVINAVQPLRALINSASTESFESEHLLACDELLDVIDEAGNRIHKIVNSILTFARPKDSNLMLKEAKVSEGIASTLSILSFRLKENIKVHLDFHWDEPIPCYPELLNQAIMNLIINALDALKKDGGNVWVSTKGIDGHLKIQVKDDGPGISASIQEKVFTPFYSTKPPDSGTGLGLAITQEIVALHNGEIVLSSSEGCGTQIEISIPISTDCENEEDYVN